MPQSDCQHKWESMQYVEIPAHHSTDGIPYILVTGMRDDGAPFYLKRAVAEDRLAQEADLRREFNTLLTAVYDLPLSLARHCPIHSPRRHEGSRDVAS